MRAVLALYVVAQHCYSTMTNDAVVPALWAFRWMDYGRLAVDAFIVVSGYCLMLPVDRRGGTLSTSAAMFYWRRCRRILPTFWAAVAVSAVAGWGPLSGRTGTVWDSCLPVTPRSLLAQAAMAGDLLRGAKVNYAFWSVATEWRIYFAFPALAWAFRRWGPGRAAAVAVAVTTTVALAVGSHEVVRNTVCYTGLFTLGMWAATTGRRRPSAAWPAAACLALAAVVVVACWSGGRALKNPAYDLAAATVVAASLAHWGQDARAAGRRLLAARPLAAVGTFSYSLYLTHAPVVQLAWLAVVRPLHVGPAAGLLVLTAVAVPAAVVAAFAFFVAFERPFLSGRQGRVVQAEVGSVTRVPALVA